MFENWLVGLITAAGIAIMAYGIRSGSKLLQEVIRKKKAEALAADRQILAVAFEGTDRILDVVTKITVSKLESNIASELRKKVKNGEARYEDLCKVSETACKEIMAQLKPEMQTVLLECIGDLEAYVKNRVEAVLPEVKAEYAQSVATGQLARNIIEGNAANETVAT